MAVDYKPLNRQQDWSSDEKMVLRRVFALAELAAVGASSIISRTVLHNTIAGKLDAGEEQDLRALFSGIRDAIDATDNAYDVVQHTTAFTMTGNKRRVIKTMAEAVVAMIV
jgi:hypothetical protein